MARVKDKVAIVSGGARGIGKATCKMLAKEGAKTAVTDIIDDEGEQVAQAIREGGGEAEFWHLDTADESAVSKVFQQIKHRFEAVDILVNNPGISGTNAPTHEISEADWQKVININVNGVFFCTKHAVPYM